MSAEIIRKRIEIKQQELAKIQNERRMLQEAINNSQFRVDQLQMQDSQISGAIIALDETLKEIEGDNGKIVDLPAAPESETPEAINEASLTER